MKKKIRYLTREEFIKWMVDNCSKFVCYNCPFGCAKCADGPNSWFWHKNMYSDKFLDQEVDLPNKHILDKQEHDYLRAVCKPYKVKYIKKTETEMGNQYIEIVVMSSVYRGLTESWSMPYFTKDTMYKGMEVDIEYSIQDLELDKEWEE